MRDLTISQEKVNFFRLNSRNQNLFLSTEADIALYGGSAGGGKTFALIYHYLQNHQMKGFSGVIVRKNLIDLEHAGSPLNMAIEMLKNVDGVVIKRSRGEILFPDYNSKLIFKSVNDQNIYKWQGAQYSYVGFDEFTHFEKDAFFYVLTRLRNTEGIQTKIKATCNPKYDSWIRSFIDWWIDEEGYAIPERSGVVRWFVNHDDRIHWFNTIEKAKKRFKNIQPLSFTYVHSRLEDNKTLMLKDPTYVSRLQNATRVEAMRLYHGNWNVRHGGGTYFHRNNFQITNNYPDPDSIVCKVRAWDLASTVPSVKNKNPNYSVGVLMAKDRDKKLYVLDVHRVQKPLAAVARDIITHAEIDGPDTIIRLTKEGGACGQFPDLLVKELIGYNVKIKKSNKSKEARAEIASTQFGARNIFLLKNHDWNDDYIRELHNFPEGRFDDCVDATVDAIDCISEYNDSGVRLLNKNKLFNQLGLRF